MGTRKISDKEIENIRKWLENNQDSRSEKIIAELEELIGKEFSTERVVCTNSAMASLHLALQTIGVGPGDEVIVDPIVVFWRNGSNVSKRCTCICRHRLGDLQY